jgi:dolichyl-phosphate-mannose--protein O-mannosyl transferase
VAEALVDAERLRRGKRQGWRSLIGGAFIVVVMLAVWIWVAVLLGPRAAGAARALTVFTFKAYAAFAFVVLSGVFAVASGVLQIRSGRRNKPLTFALVVCFVAAIFVGFTIQT